MLKKVSIVTFVATTGVLLLALLVAAANLPAIELLDGCGADGCIPWPDVTPIVRQFMTHGTL